MGRELPPLAAEDHVCEECGVVYATVDTDEALAVIGTIPDAARAAVEGVAAEMVRLRPSPERWSAIEYLCHLRDVYLTFTIRLYRTRVEDRPALEPMYNDLRAARFHYERRPVAAVLDELRDNVEGFGAEAARVGDDGWARLATRLPHEARTARWLVRQAMHEGVHHVRDIEAVLVACGHSVPPPGIQ